MIAPHECADRDDAHREEQLGRLVVGPLPEHPGPDRKDQHFLQEPDQRSVVGPRRRPLHQDVGGLHGLRVLVAPGHVDGAADLVAQAAQRVNVIAVVPLMDLEWTDRHQPITDVRTAVIPDVIAGNLLLYPCAKHAPDADRAHRGDMRQHGDRIDQHKKRARHPHSARYGAAPAGDGASRR